MVEFHCCGLIAAFAATKDNGKCSGPHAGHDELRLDGSRLALVEFDRRHAEMRTPARGNGSRDPGQPAYKAKRNA